MFIVPGPKPVITKPRSTKLITVTACGFFISYFPSQRNKHSRNNSTFNGFLSFTEMT